MLACGRYCKSGRFSGSLIDLTGMCVVCHSLQWNPSQKPAIPVGTRIICLGNNRGLIKSIEHIIQSY